MELIAFVENSRIARGSASEIKQALLGLSDAHTTKPVLIFEASSGRRVELDTRPGCLEASDGGTNACSVAPRMNPSRGRPKLGVVAREVTLLPRQWDWLGQQRGGASAALRRLVDASQRTSSDTDRLRQAQEAVYRFITVLAGDAPGYEEAVRSLFAGDLERFTQQLSGWPADVRAHALELASSAFPTPNLLQQFLPDDRIEPAARALTRLFGTTFVGGVEPLAGRSGATVLKIVNGAEAVVLRLDVAPDGFRDPARHYACHAIAAQAGVAPALLHADLPARISISSFVEQGDAPTDDARLIAVATALSKLHAAPLFPPLMPFIEAMDRLIGAFASSDLLTPSQVNRVRAVFDEVRCGYAPAERDLVASHNDLNPTNVLFAGGKAIFVDWETAFAADRYVDLAAVMNFLARSETDEQLVLETYFGRQPTEDERHRLQQMRQVSRLYYGIMLLGAARRAQPDLVLAADVLEGNSSGEKDAPPVHPMFEVQLGCRFLADALRWAGSAV